MFDANVCLGKDAYDRTAAALANDTGSFKQATNALKLAVIIATFSKLPTTPVGDLTLNDDVVAPDLAPILLATGPQAEGIEPVTKNRIVRITPPIGGFQFTLSGDLDDPITVHGFALMTNDLAKVLALVKYETPVAIQYSDEFVECPAIDIPIPISAF